METKSSQIVKLVTYTKLTETETIVHSFEAKDWDDLIICEFDEREVDPGMLYEFTQEVSKIFQNKGKACFFASKNMDTTFYGVKPYTEEDASSSLENLKDWSGEDCEQLAFDFGEA